MIYPQFRWLIHSLIPPQNGMMSRERNKYITQKEKPDSTRSLPSNNNSTKQCSSLSFFTKMQVGAED